MDLSGNPRGTPYPAARTHLTSRHEDLSLSVSSWGELSTSPTIHVLSVGRIETDRLMCDELLDSPDFRISFVDDYRDLWIYSRQHVVNAVVMHNTLCSFELAEAARLVRNRWPNAKILIIRSGEVSLDRALYDERLHPPVKQRVLVEQVRLLIDSLREGEAVENTSQVPLYLSLPQGTTTSLDRQRPMVSSNSTAAIPQSRLDKIKLSEFVDVVERYRPQLIWLAMRITNRTEDAEDIVQQALVKAFRKLSGFRGDSQMRTWLNAIVKNTAREYIRSQRGRTFIPLESPSFLDEGGDEIEIFDHRMNPEEYYEHRERDDVVAAAIGGMDPGNREVVVMCVFQELPYMEVATALNLSLSTVKSRMFRSRRDLRMALSSHPGDLQ